MQKCVVKAECQRKWVTLRNVYALSFLYSVCVRVQVCVCVRGGHGSPLGTKQRGFPTIISDISRQKVTVSGFGKKMSINLIG